MDKSLNLLILGRSGSGKGTQADLLQERLDIEIYVSTGNLFRSLAKKDSLAGRKIKEILNKGGLPEDWIASFLWQRKLVEELQSENESIIFDGVARRVNEAKLLDKVMKWFNKDLTPILLDVTREEAFKRLKDRGREDDTDENIKNRLDWYESEVIDVVNYFDNQDRLVRVDGMDNIEGVFENILKALNIENEWGE